MVINRKAAEVAYRMRAKRGPWGLHNRGAADAKGREEEAPVECPGQGMHCRR